MANVFGVSGYFEMRKWRSGLEVINFFSCATILSTKLLVKTKIPTNKEVSCLKSLEYCIYLANKF